jgi:hypothetical protein
LYANIYQLLVIGPTWKQPKYDIHTHTHTHTHTHSERERERESERERERERLRKDPAIKTSDNMDETQKYYVK